MITGHGGDIQETAARLGCDTTDLIDMSSNLNPLGPLPGMEEFLAGNIRAIITLPDADTERISKSLAHLYGIKQENITAGNGTTQFIYNLPLALKLKNALIAGPVYADYADACQMHGAKTEMFMPEATWTEKNLFEWDFERLAAEARNFDAVYVCNPNSPTGSLVDTAHIKMVAEKNPSKWIIVDETYLPFIKSWQKHSLLYTDLPNLIVFHSMSKIHRLPGLRIGFMKADREVVSRYMDFFMPWSVNSLAQAAVFHLSENKKMVESFIEESADYALTQKKIITDGLMDKGIEFYPSSSVFMLARLGKGLPSARVFHDMMLDKKIMIRDCSNFKGLSDRHFRISLHMPENNLKFIRAACECLGSDTDSYSALRS